MTEFKVGDIQPNPFRHMDRYPIRRDKVEALRESLRTTGFWDNVVARVRPDGKPEIAYGHHRLTALKEEYGEDRVVSLIVRELDDDHMLKIMARENMEEWGTSAAVEQETVRAVVEAYADGRITLPALGLDGRRVRNAPSFADVSTATARPDAMDKPYTTAQIAEYLGWVKPSGKPQDKVGEALSALEFIEEGILSERDFDGLSTSQAQAVIEQARRVKRQREEAAKRAEEQARKAAAERVEAERRQAEAARKQAEAEERAAKTREESERRRAEAEAAHQAAEQQRQREQAEAAERRRRDQETRAQKERQQAREQTSRVGKHVASEIRSGSKGTKQAAAAAAEVGFEPGKKKVPDINRFAEQLAASLLKILEPGEGRNAHVRDLDLLTEHKENADPDSIREVVTALREVSRRANVHAQRLDDTSPHVQYVVAEPVRELRAGSA